MLPTICLFHAVLVLSIIQLAAGTYVAEEKRIRPKNHRIKNSSNLDRRNHNYYKRKTNEKKYSTKGKGKGKGAKGYNDDGYTTGDDNNNGNNNDNIFDDHFGDGDDIVIESEASFLSYCKSGLLHPSLTSDGLISQYDIAILIEHLCIVFDNNINNVVPTKLNCPISSYLNLDLPVRLSFAWYVCPNDEQISIMDCLTNLEGQGGAFGLSTFASETPDDIHGFCCSLLPFLDEVNLTPLAVPEVCSNSNIPQLDVETTTIPTPSPIIIAVPNPQPTNIPTMVPFQQQAPTSHPNLRPTLMPSQEVPLPTTSPPNMPVMTPPTVPPSQQPIDNPTTTTNVPTTVDMNRDNSSPSPTITHTPTMTTSPSVSSSSSTGNNDEDPVPILQNTEPANSTMLSAGETVLVALGGAGLCIIFGLLATRKKSSPGEDKA